MILTLGKTLSGCEGPVACGACGGVRRPPPFELALTGEGVRSVNGWPFVTITVVKRPTGWIVTITIGLM